MAIVEIPDESRELQSSEEIQAWLRNRGILFDQWETEAELAENTDPESILVAYEHVIRPYMDAHGYTSADVIRIHPEQPNIDELRWKFLYEHTHTEDEVRFFVEGRGFFWFRLQDEPVFGVLCEPGDLISVPAGVRHWFDMGAAPKLTAIRIFHDTAGWIPHYTDSGIARKYNKPYDQKLT